MIRFAIWAAVSTKEQAASDKISLENQVERCRGAGLAKGWQETAGPYIAAGASRSFYVDLSLAKTNIPKLKTLLDDAHSNRYDVLMIYTYDRLGDLADLVAQELRFDHVQLYSLIQAVEPQPPDQFDPYNSEAEAIMRDASRITQRFRINDLRRKFRAGLPERVRCGLTPLKVSYGYIWTGKKTPPRLDPVKAAVILRIRDEFMAGRSMNSIARRLSADGIPSPHGCPKWEITTIRVILSNPVYAGKVVFGKTVRVHDPRRKSRSRQVYQPSSNWECSPGLQEPLWDDATEQAILGELQLRADRTKNYGVRFPLSGLLVCGICGRKVHRLHSGSGKFIRLLLTCQEEGVKHVRLEYEPGVDQISCFLAEAIASRNLVPLSPPEPNPADRNEQTLAELAIRRKRIQDGYESGLYTHIEAAEKLAALKKQADLIQDKVRQIDQSAQAWSEWQQLVASLPGMLEHFPEWIRSEDPILINRLLMSIVEKILVCHDQITEIVWRK